MIVSTALMQLASAHCLLSTTRTIRIPPFRTLVIAPTYLQQSSLDDFLQPYGVQAVNITHDDDWNGTELLQALIPRPPSEQEILVHKAQLFESFQRTRLKNQLRYRRLFDTENGGNIIGEGDHFQRARLTEQLRLSKKTAFPRSFENMNAALDEYNSEREAEVKRGSVTMIMSHDGQDAGKKNEGEMATFGQATEGRFVEHSLDGVMMNSTHLSSYRLGDKLKRLHRIVKIATNASVGSPPAPPNTTEISSMQGHSYSDSAQKRSFGGIKSVGRIDLPLPPREDAGILSLVMAPIAYLLSSLFLATFAAFYAMLSILDILWKDVITKTCLTEATGLWRSCLDHIFRPSSDSREGHDRLFKRIVEASATAVSGLFHISRCVVLRAIRHSKYAEECTEACLGSVRYLVFSMRSINILRSRLVYSWRHPNRPDAAFGTQSARNANGLFHTSRRKFHLYGIVSSIKTSVSNRLNVQRSLQLEQRRVRLEQDYKEKLHTLNRDRIALERNKLELRDAQSRIDEDRKKLLCEGVTVLAWYCAAVEAAAVTDGSPGTEQERWSLHKWWKSLGLNGS